jgi:osmoprotectant transport system permease protein
VNPRALSEQLALLPDYLGSHLLLTLLALGVGVVVCLPLGFLVTRVRALQWPTLTAAGVLQTIPGLALLALMVPLLGTIGFVPAVLALILYSFLPILRNTVTGILGVDSAVREAAVGIGMTDRQLLWRVELPLALPVIIAGIRTAAVWVVGTATLATPVGATSLGNYIFSGLQTQNLTAVVVGCVSAAGLAIVLDQLIQLVERAARLRSMRLAIVSGAVLVLALAGGIAPWAATSASPKQGRTVVVGSKPFTEQYILAEVIASQLSDAGYTVERKPGMGSIILFEAVAAGDVDCYVDYSGTLWANVLKRDDVAPRDVVLKQLTHWLDSARGVVSQGALGFENTYALAVPQSLAQRHGLKDLDDLARVSPELAMGSDYEFFSRPEWNSLRDRYGLHFRELRTLDPSLMYAAVHEGDVDVISAYSTDGRIIDFGLVTLNDPRQALPPYDAILVLSRAAGRDLEIRAALEPLIGGIDAALMREANRRVDQEGMAPDSVAAWLRARLAATIP